MLENAKGIFSTCYIQASDEVNIKNSTQKKIDAEKIEQKLVDGEEEANNDQLSNEFSTPLNTTMTSNKALKQAIESSFDYLEYTHLKNTLNESVNSNHSTLNSKKSQIIHLMNQEGFSQNNSLLKMNGDSSISMINKEEAVQNKEKTTENDILVSRIFF